MKARRSLLLLLTLVLAVVGARGLWVWKAKRQYALNRQLIAALKNNDAKQALALVNRGADPNTRYNPPPAPTLTQLFNHLLHRSLVPANDSPTAFLMACGANWNVSSKDIKYGDDSPRNVSLIRAMLTHGGDSNTTDFQHWSALSIVVWSNNRYIAQLLLEHGANVNAQNLDGMTPLMFAVSSLDVGMIRLLLDHGANISIGDRWGATALHYAVAEDNAMNIARLLLAYKANPNQPDKHGLTPLNYAQQHHRLDIVALLRGKR